MAGHVECSLGGDIVLELALVRAGAPGVSRDGDVVAGGDAHLPLVADRRERVGQPRARRQQLQPRLHTTQRL